MSLQPLLTILMSRMTFSNLTEGIPHQKLIIARCEDGSGDVDEDGDPGVIVVGEGLAAEEDGCHDAGAEISGQVGGDGDVGEGPDHGRVGHADGERGSGGGDEGVGRVQAGPDDEADVGIDEEFDEEEESEIRLCRGWEGA